MYTPKSFESAKEFWQPREKFSPSFAGHALCVVGYDDSKFGGAFEVMNSWGSEWGNDGFMWIRYETFAEFVPYAFELFHINGDNPDAVDMAGKITIELNSGGQMNVQMTDNPGYYKVSDSYASGTLFQIAIESVESGFLYVFGSDLSKEIFPLFPSGNMSAALPYKESHVVLPAETQYIEIDNNPGTDFLCIVYSKEDLWLDDIKRQLEAVDGEFIDRVKTVFSDQLVDVGNVSYRPNSVEFFGKSKGKTVIAVILEIGHI